MTKRIIGVRRGGLSDFERAALGMDDMGAANRAPIVPEREGPPIALKAQFDFQSYFDTTLYERALRDQPASEEIVPSTVRDDDIPGYAIALHGASQTPIAVQFRLGGSRGSAGGVVILSPGQFIRPIGLLPGEARAAFGGFRWGVPFGWLGGGSAMLLVFQNPEGFADYGTSSQEIQFHRMRLPFGARTLVNWPLRFPSPFTTAGTNSQPQRGQPSLAIEPTRFLVRLNATAIAAPARILMTFTTPDDFGGQGSGYATTEFMFPAGVNYPVVEVTGPGARLGGDSCIVSLTDADAQCGAATMDFIRYGRL